MSRKNLEHVPGAGMFVPVERTLRALRRAIPTCRGCALYRDATQPVFGEGANQARVMLIGEVPGDAEDVAGRPLVGLAGWLLDEALAAAGIPRPAAYVTNVVKHFKFTRRGTGRIHDKPSHYEIEACKPWLAAELDSVKPEIVVLLGATAAQALLGAGFLVTRARGHVLDTHLARFTLATVHPAAVLRTPDDDARRLARRALFADLALAGDCYRRVMREHAA